MAKRNDPKKNLDYTEEDMSETEEYFQTASTTNPTNKNNSTDNSFELLNTQKVDDGVTIGVLPSKKTDTKRNLMTSCLKLSMRHYHRLENPSRTRYISIFKLILA